MNKYTLHVLSIKLRDKLYFSFSIPTPGFPHFYYMLGANMGLLLYGEVSVMSLLVLELFKILFIIFSIIFFYLLFFLFIYYIYF